MGVRHVRDPVHADGAVGPRLPCRPRDGVRTVRLLGDVDVHVLAARAVAAADVLDRHGVPGLASVNGFAVAHVNG